MSDKEDYNNIVSIQCGFCKKKNMDINGFFFSKEYNLYICSNCIYLLSKHSFDVYNIDTLTPKKIFYAIKEFVIGQDEAAKDLSLIFYKHLLYINNFNDISLKKIKGNALVLGPTGTGKTYMIDIASKMLGIPFLSVDMSGTTATGYVGKDVESIFYNLYKLVDGSYAKMKHAVIFLDEFDKISSSDSEVARDVKSGVQHELLKIFEGFPIDVSPDPKKPFQSKVKIYTDGLLIIAGGAFQSVQKIIQKRTSSDLTGDHFYDYDNVSHMKHGNSMMVIRDEVVNSGIIPELAARFQSIVSFRTLDKFDYIKILNHHDSRLNHYLRIFLRFNIIINISDEIKEYISLMAVKLDIGVRGLVSIIDATFNRYFYDIDEIKGSSIDITQSVIDNIFIRSINNENK